MEQWARSLAKTRVAEGRASPDRAHSVGRTSSREDSLNKVPPQESTASIKVPPLKESSPSEHLLARREQSQRATGFFTLPALMQEVQTLIRRTVPPI